MPTAGTCMVMGTASTMACLTETLGFTLPGAATAPAVSSDRTRLAEATGTRAAQMAVAGTPRPRDILTKQALRNASVVLQATSGSTNALVHLSAIAGRAGIAYDLAEFDRVGRDVPTTAIWAARAPVASARRVRSEDTAGAVAAPGRVKPSVSVRHAMVEAVPITMQVPAVGIS